MELKAKILRARNQKIKNQNQTNIERDHELLHAPTPTQETKTTIETESLEDLVKIARALIKDKSNLTTHISKQNNHTQPSP